MSNEYEQSADLSSVNNGITTVENVVDASITLSGNASFQQTIEVNTTTWETIYTNVNSGFISVRGVVDSFTSGTVTIEVYNNSVSPLNLIGKTILTANSSACATCFPIWYKDGVIVRAIGSVADPFWVIIGDIQSNPAGFTEVIDFTENTLAASGSGTTILYNGGFIDLDRGTFGNTDRGLLGVNLSSIPNGALIQSAILKLGAYATNPFSSNETYQIYGVLQPYNGPNTSWVNYDTGSPWATPGLGAGTDRDTNPIVQVNGVASFNEHVDFDITTWVQDVISGNRANNGLHLKMADDLSNGPWTRIAINGTVDVPAAKLVVTYV